MNNKNTSFRGQFELNNKVAVVTGGIGILGKRFCAGLAEFGAKVAVVDLDEINAVAYADELQEVYGVECIGVACDVRQPDSVKNMTDNVEKILGPIEILHNNAASKGSDLKNFLAPLEEYSLETWNEIMSVNLDGMFIVAQAIGTKMANRGCGSIIQTASIYGSTMGPDQNIYEGSEYMGMHLNSPPVYSASKGGVVGLTNYLATYWAQKGVRVNALSPGGIESGQNEIFYNQYSKRVPMQRMGDRDEMVGALIFLASDASSYITGQNIFVDGGLNAW
jgi:NAD(P)-dependent dehydrogenase (short-subunit alcohol dehydrogenase family)